MPRSSCKENQEFLPRIKQFQLEHLQTAIFALELGAIAIAAISFSFTYRQSKLAERFAGAVEQLGHQDISVRVSEVYELERIAKDSRAHQWAVMEVLTAYVRDRSALPEEQVLAKLREAEGLSFQTATTTNPIIGIDIKSATKVISRRNVSRDKDYLDLDLRDTNLAGARFYEANLKNAFFSRSDLSVSNFVGADLTSAKLDGATLHGAFFNNANLTKADLIKAKLWGANLTKANLAKVNLTGADLAEAGLSGARNLTDAQLQSAKLCKTKLPEASRLHPNRDCKMLGIKTP